MFITENKFAFVDVETTGTNTARDRIIEVGVVRVESGKVSRKWSTLVDPQTYIPPEISRFTGITENDLRQAPSFRGISDELSDILDGCVFVAHNARFDYGFIRNEFKRLGINYHSKQLCTVKLSRHLFPGEQRHNLDALIVRHNLKVNNRHRALDDADAIAQFFDQQIGQFDSNTFNELLIKIVNHPTVPTKYSHLHLDDLPDSPGVYILHGESGIPLYIGKSININSRIKQHFSSSLSQEREMRLSMQTTDIETIVCAGELSALILESELIKKYQPIYNRRLRKSTDNYRFKLVMLDSGYKSVQLDSGTDFDPDSIGNFSSGKQAQKYLREICRENNLCESLLGLEKVRTRCFNFDLSKCQACSGIEKPEKYNLRFDLSFVGQKILPWPFSGPIAIKEGNESLFFDNWSFVGKSKEDTYLDGSKPFDPDLYQILKQYINKPGNLTRIHQVKRKPDTDINLSEEFESGWNPELVEE